MWKRWCIKDNVFCSAFKLGLMQLHQHLEQSWLKIPFSTQVLQLPTFSINEVLYLFSLICWRTTLLNSLSAEGYAEIHVKLSVISVITMTGTLHWVSAVTQCVLWSPSCHSKPPHYGHKSQTVETVFLMLILPKGQVSYLKHSSSCLDCS